MRVSLTHLTVKMILNKEPEVIGLGFSSLSRPLRKLCRTILVAVDAEACIGLQPLTVLFDETLVVCRTLCLGTLLLIDEMQVIHLGLEHALIVNLRQGIQFLTQLFEPVSFLLVFYLWQLSEVTILRMQSIDTDTIVRIGILPHTRHIRIGNGQNLKNTLFGLVTPVNHQLQIAKVTNAEATSRTERKYRNDGTSTFPRIDGEEGL